jgi:hypothetical protein
LHEISHHLTHVASAGHRRVDPSDDSFGRRAAAHDDGARQTRTIRRHSRPRTPIELGQQFLHLRLRRDAVAESRAYLRSPDLEKRLKV